MDVANIGENLTDKKSGNQNDATSKNRMGDSSDNCMPHRTYLEGGVELQIKLLKWLTNLKICYTKSLDKLYHVAPLHRIKNCFSNSFVNHVDINSSTAFNLKTDSGATCHYLIN